MTNRISARSAPLAAFASPRARPEPTVLQELIAALAPHPKGLRRWSVMRAIRDNRVRECRPVSLKFEIEVERVFRGACSDAPGGNPGAPFYRPEGKAGEVWAVHTAHACHAQTAAGGQE